MQIFFCIQNQTTITVENDRKKHLPKQSLHHLLRNYEEKVTRHKEELFSLKHAINDTWFEYFFNISKTVSKSLDFQ